MPVVEGGRPLSKWSQFWIGAIQLLSCGVCSRDSADPLSTTREKQYTIEPSGEKAATVPPATPQLFTAQSPYVEGQTMCLMDLPDDCLLQIIDRLSFLDRLRIRVNRRLNALEPHATAIANTAERHRFNFIKFIAAYSLNDIQTFSKFSEKISVLNDREWFDLSVASGMNMLQRIIKCCILGTFRGEIIHSYIHRMSCAIRYLKTDHLHLTNLKETGILEEGVSIQPYLECMRNNEKMTLTLYRPQDWINIDQILAIIEVAQQLRSSLVFYDLDLTTGEKMAHHYMGIDPSILLYPERDFTNIHTSIKDREIYISLGEMCWTQGKRRFIIRRDLCYQRDRFIMTFSEEPRPLNPKVYIRVLYKEEQ